MMNSRLYEKWIELHDIILIEYPEEKTLKNENKEFVNYINKIADLINKIESLKPCE